jgi:amino acid transporter/mannitol/fructose-specific phosphotransferase system IIA component (Ntr-type)
MKKAGGLGVWDIFSMGSGSMISSGIFILPALAYASSGSAMVAAYLLGGVLMLPAVAARLELSTAIPGSGGLYFLMERILGTGAGLLSGASGWIMIVLKSSLALAGIEAFVLYIYPSADAAVIKAAALVVLFAFTALNALTVEGTGSLQSLMVLGLLAVMFAFLGLGYPLVSIDRIRQAFRPDALGILATSALVFISYGGIDKIANVAEEVRNPGKTLVRGILAAFFSVQALYILVTLVLSGIMDGAELAHAPLPLSAAAEKILPGAAGTAFGAIMAAGGILAFLTTANAGLLSASRIPFAIARDGSLPAAFARRSSKGIPIVGIVVTSVAMAAAIVFLDLEGLAKVASGFMLFQFALQMVALAVMRRLPTRNYKPTFRMPLAVVVAPFGFAAYSIMLVTLGPLPIAVTAGFTALSVLWYFAYARKRNKRVSALAKLVAGIAGKDLLPEDDPLETELLGILLRRESISPDAVDEAIRNSAVLDLAAGVPRETALQLAAEAVAEAMGMEAEAIAEILDKRERDISTILYPGTAIPHAVLPGADAFRVVLLRCGAGIAWTDGAPPVRSAFFLFGTPDQRAFHLQCLAAIAQTLQAPGFKERWESARDAQELRNALLLSERRRWSE